MRIVVAAALLAASVGAGAQGPGSADGQLTLGTGLHYSSGDYGTPVTTTILSIPFTARYDRGPWSLRASLPWVEVSGANTVVPGFGRVNPGGRGRGSPAGESTTSGLGDLVASATYAAYYDRASQLGVDLTAKVKLATADEGLGTGEHDFAALADVFKVVDRVTWFAGVGYHMLGSSASFPLDDVWSWSAGASYRIDARDSAGLVYDARERASPGSGALSELTAFWSRRLDRAWKTQVYLLKGFANGSPDWGAGLSLAYSF